MNILEIVRSVSWEPGIGDPTLAGWVTAAVYLFAGTCCALCAWQAARSSRDRVALVQRLLWAGLAAALFFLGVNKQLDLHTWFTAVVKAIAWEQGWYERGQQAQVWFVAGLGGASLVVLVAGSWGLRHSSRQYWRRHYWLILLGGLFLACFVVVRVATFYGVPLPALSRFPGGIRVNGLLEIGGALAIAAAALINLRWGGV